MIWLLSALGFAKKALTAALGLVQRYPLQAVCIALLCLSAWLWHGKGKAIEQRDEAIAGRKADRKAYETAQAEATAKAIAALKAQEARYKSLAKEADNAHAIELASASADTDRFIRSSRMRCQASGSATSGTAAPAESGSASVPESLPGDSILVAERDVRACTAATIYAIGAHNWAKGLGE